MAEEGSSVGVTRRVRRAGRLVAMDQTHPAPANLTYAVRMTVGLTRLTVGLTR